MVAAEAVELAGRPDAVGGGIGPEGQEDPGVGGGASRAAVDRADGVVERGEVEGLDVGPDGAGGVLVGEQGIEGQGAIDDLIAIGPPESGPPDADRGGRHGPVGRGQVEEGGLLGGG